MICPNCGKNCQITATSKYDYNGDELYWCTCGWCEEDSYDDYEDERY
jgi:YHS domain-containing protein